MLEGGASHHRDFLIVATVAAINAEPSASPPFEVSAHAAVTATPCGIGFHAHGDSVDTNDGVVLIVAACA